MSIKPFLSDFLGAFIKAPSKTGIFIYLHGMKILYSTYYIVVFITTMWFGFFLECDSSRYIYDWECPFNVILHVNSEFWTIQILTDMLFLIFPFLERLLKSKQDLYHKGLDTMYTLGMHWTFLCDMSHYRRSWNHFCELCMSWLCIDIDSPSLCLFSDWLNSYTNLDLKK